MEASKEKQRKRKLEEQKREVIAERAADFAQTKTNEQGEDKEKNEAFEAMLQSLLKD